MGRSMTRHRKVLHGASRRRLLFRQISDRKDFGGCTTGIFAMFDILLLYSTPQINYLSLVMPGNDDVEAKALEMTVKKAMEEATMPFKDKLENLTLKIEETEGHNEANMRQSFLHFNPFRIFNPPPPFSGNFGETFSDWIGKLTHFMTLQGIDMAREVSDLQNELKSIKGMLKIAMDGLSKKQYNNELPKPSVFKRIAFEQPPTWKQDRTEIHQCHACLEWGHIARDCTKPCRHCSESGHHPDHCTAKNRVARTRDAQCKNKWKDDALNKEMANEGKAASWNGENLFTDLGNTGACVASDGHCTDSDDTIIWDKAQFQIVCPVVFKGARDPVHFSETLHSMPQINYLSL
uniref:CCHC-type domain-containing protein n=1 Tax=Romanomermis culicivorax TaxID=13658 RepID=A0A915KJJ3_ROMCU